jgi:hypothetical protein
VWWRPDRLGWWIGALFAVGSLLFLVPALAALDSSAEWIGWTFFIGSIFFTSAAYLQYFQAANAGHAARPRGERRPLRPVTWRPLEIGWLASLIQFAGTILFNLNTFDALNNALTAHQANVRVWTPDMVGSACFLVASVLAYVEAGDRWLSWRPHDLGWSITAINLAGSVAFGVSAVASFVRPATGGAVNDTISNIGTATGALCFLIGALLLMPEADREARRAAQPAAVATAAT